MGNASDKRFVASDLHEKHKEIALKTNTKFVTSALYANDSRALMEKGHRVRTYWRKCIANEHKVCNLRFVCNILQKSHEI